MEFGLWVQEEDLSGFAFGDWVRALTRGSPCVFTQSTLAVWVKWPFHPSAPDLAGHKRQFGSVCHQDPRSVLLAPPLCPCLPGYWGERVLPLLWSRVEGCQH